MINTDHAYLQRLEERLLTSGLKRQIVFGMGLGWILFFLGGFNYYFVVGAHDVLWKTLGCIGVLFLVVSIVFPTAFAPLEKLWMMIGKRIGSVIFGVILTAVYFLFFVPIGILVRSRKSQPFYSWDKVRPINAEGWVEKRQTLGHLSQNKITTKKRSLVSQAFYVLSFFVKNGNYFLIPVLFILLVFGLLMFFVQTSALAPFIYTLF